MEDIPSLQDSIPNPGRCPKLDDHWKELFRGYEMRQTAIFYLFWFSSYSLSKIHSDLFTLIGLAELLMFNKNWPLIRKLGSQMVPNGRPSVPLKV